MAQENNSLDNPNVLDQVKQFLGVILAVIAIAVASSGYLSSFAKADEVSALETKHDKDMVQAKLDAQQLEVERYTDQIYILENNLSQQAQANYLKRRQSDLVNKMATQK